MNAQPQTSRLLSLRHRLHQCPEQSGKEILTSTMVAGFLTEYEPDQLLTSIGGHGIVALWKGPAKGPTILFRAELDALPIHDHSGKPYHSKYQGMGHQCGHDGHIAILAGLAAKLHHGLIKRGTVGLLFQPAEETGMGAKAMLDSGVVQKLHPDHIFALHNLPGYAVNSLVWTSGPFTAAVISVDLRFTGKEAHAATPEMGANPAMAISELLHTTKNMAVTAPEDDHFLLITPIQIQLGQPAYGTSPGTGVLSFTVRCWTNRYLDEVCEKLIHMVELIASKHNLSVHLEWKEHFAATENHPESAQLVYDAAQKLELTIEKMTTPHRFGEDFGRFTTQFPGAMVGLGAGKQHPPLHDPAYDFPDEILPTGMALFTKILEELQMC